MANRFQIGTIVSIRAAAWLAVAAVACAAVVDDPPRPKSADKKPKAEAKLSAREKEFANKIRPMLKEYCIKCHGMEKTKGGLDLSTFTDFKSVTEEPEVWTNVFERVQADEMPPKKAREMPIGKRVELIAWARSFSRARSIAPNWRATAR